MRDLGRTISQLRFFWVVMSLTGYSTRQDDIDDAIDFVISFGERGFQEFSRDLESYHHISAMSGLTAHVTRRLAERLSHIPSDAEIRATLEAFAVSGQHYFASCVDNPDVVEDARSLESTLEVTLRERFDSMTDIPSTAKSLKMLAPLRRGGDPWILMRLGLGLGVGWNDDWPFNTWYFSTRVYKLAAMCSQRGDWLDLRKHGHFRHVDVSVEWWRDLTVPDTAWVKRRSSTTLEVFVPRPTPRGDRDRDVDGISVGNEDARLVMATAMDLISEFIVTA